MLTDGLTTGWAHGLAGGLLIGLAAVALFGLLGRIAGISGILGGVLTPETPAESSWRLAFLAGLLVAGGLAAPVPAMTAGTSMPLLIVAGLLVGFGTRLGSGCTSGHGVCGLGRLSWRSLVATLVFMASGVLTVLLLRHGHLVPGGL